MRSMPQYTSWSLLCSSLYIYIRICIYVYIYIWVYIEASTGCWGSRRPGEARHGWRGGAARLGDAAHEPPRQLKGIS